VLSTVAEIEAQGFRDAGLHAVAARLKAGYEPHPHASQAAAPKPPAAST
jgi:hypothetical protein